MSAAVVARIVSEVPGLGGSPAAVETLRRGNEATTLLALSALAGESAAVPPAGEATLHSVRQFVHAGVPLELVLHGVRAGHAATTEAFLGACAKLVDPDSARDELTAVSRELFRYVDELADTMIRTYLSEHEVWSTSAAAARAATVRAVLADPALADVGEASRSLGYDLRRAHLSVVVWSDSPTGAPTLQTAAVDILRARGATATLVVPGAAGRVSAWGSVPSNGAGSAVAAEQILSRARLNAAFGSAGDGVVGFRRAHREAEQTERLELLRRAAGRGTRRLTDHADVAVVTLAVTDLDAAGDFVRRELGELARGSEAMAALRTTLFHYLEAERSLVDVARRLHVARGTVTYRVRRAQQVLGRDVGDRRLALHTALLLAEELGDAVLVAPDVVDH